MNICQQLLRTGNFSRQATPGKTDTDIGQTAERHQRGRGRLKDSSKVRGSQPLRLLQPLSSVQDTATDDKAVCRTTLQRRREILLLWTPLGVEIQEEPGNQELEPNKEFLFHQRGYRRSGRPTQLPESRSRLVPDNTPFESGPAQFRSGQLPWMGSFAGSFCALRRSSWVRRKRFAKKAPVGSNTGPFSWPEKLWETRTK